MEDSAKSKKRDLRVPIILWVCEVEGAGRELGSDCDIFTTRNDFIVKKIRSAAHMREVYLVRKGIYFRLNKANRVNTAFK